MGFKGLTAVRVWTAFGLLPVALCLVVFRLYENPVHGENSDPIVWALLLAVAAAATWLGRPGAEGLIARLQAPIANPARGLTLLMLVALVLYLVVARLVLDAFTNSGDEIAYVLQAQTYGRGRLWVDPPPVVDAFEMQRFFTVQGHWLSQYPPGWAVVMAPFAAVGAPLWIVNPILGAAMLGLFYAVARRHLARGTAWLAVLVLGFCAFWVLTCASYFNHPLTTLFALAFALFGERYLDRGKARDALLAGLFVGLLGVTRTQNAVPFAAAFLLMTLPRADRRLGLVWFGLGGAPLLAALLGYNALTTSDALAPPQTQNSLGPEPLGEMDTQSLRLTVSRLFRLHSWGAPLPLYGAVAGFLALAWRRRLGLTDWIFPITVAMFLAYGGDGGNQYGPRYYFEAWPFAILTAAKVADGLFASPDRRVREWIASATLATLVLELAYLGPRLWREHQVVRERQQVCRAVAEAGLKRAIVVVEDQVGMIRGMAPSDLVQNGLDVTDRDIVYAHAVPHREADLLRAYPGRAFYTYAKGRLAPRPTPP